MFSFLSRRRQAIGAMEHDIHMLKGNIAIVLAQEAALMMVLGATLIAMNKNQRDSVIEAIKREVAKGISVGAPDSIDENFKPIYMNSKSAMLQNFIEAIGPS
jgi:hypothetical protein